MTVVRFLPEDKSIEGADGSTLLDLAREAGLDLVGPCAGRALCGKCVLRILEGEAVSGTTDDEKVALPAGRIGQGYRLGCRCRVAGKGEVTVLVPSDSRTGSYVLLTQGETVVTELDPYTAGFRAKLRPDAQIPRSGQFSPDSGRAQLHLDDAMASRLRGIINADQTREVLLVASGGEVVDVKEGGHVLGFAIDIGTTKVAGYLVDLMDGTTRAVVSDLNPQVVCGEDVVSRIQCAIEGGLDRLQRMLLECANDLLRRACVSAGESVQDVYEVVAVGNSVMRQLLIKGEPRELAFYPYQPSSKQAWSCSTSEIGLIGNRTAKLFLPPVVAGFVGSDVLADLVATRMSEPQGGAVLVDIGTNTEIVVKGRRRTLTCSTASGPAFEGAHIACGMRAAIGAIDRVEIDENGETRYTVIGGGRPLGLTGSAVVDTIAEFIRVRLVDKGGKLVSGGGSSRIRDGSRGYREFVVAYGRETAAGADITLDQKDIREIQLAKAAIRAGLNILMKEAELETDDVGVLNIAGAFGFFLNPSSAMAIGLYPRIPLEKVRLVGNTAVTGARAMLLSVRERELAARLASAIEYVELAKHPRFREEFMNAIPMSGRPEGYSVGRF